MRWRPSFLGQARVTSRHRCMWGFNSLSLCICRALTDLKASYEWMMTLRLNGTRAHLWMDIGVRGGFAFS